MKTYQQGQLYSERDSNLSTWVMVWLKEFSEEGLTVLSMKKSEICQLGSPD